MSELQEALDLLNATKGGDPGTRLDTLETFLREKCGLQAAPESEPGPPEAEETGAPEDPLEEEEEEE